MTLHVAMTAVIETLELSFSSLKRKAAGNQNKERNVKFLKSSNKSASSHSNIGENSTSVNQIFQLHEEISTLREENATLREKVAKFQEAVHTARLKGEIAVIKDLIMSKNDLLEAYKSRK